MGRGLGQLGALPLARTDVLIRLISFQNVLFQSSLASPLNPQLLISPCVLSPILCSGVHVGFTILWCS